MFGFWFLDPNLNFSLLTARLAASIIAIIFFLPLQEISHIWLSHIFSGVKFNIKSYSLAELFDPIGALFMLLFGCHPGSFALPEIFIGSSLPGSFRC